MKRLSAAIIFAFVSIWSVSSAQPKHEMRMVWIATVNNIDWVPAGAVEPYRQQEAMIAMLDTFKQLNINAIVLQIRPTADAFYQSHVEPWSHFLTGKQGRAPYPYYDPLAFTIEQAHKRNIDVHVWLNPYRLLNSDNTDILQRNSLFFSRPNMFIKYGSQYFFNPARQETLEHLGKVVADIVSRYDIDALHIDDYFYPYPIEGKEFPDAADFRADPRGFKNRADWRRDNVNRAIDVISSTIKRIKPYVEFGVSPFGVWRNKSRDPRGSDTKALSNYDDLYADVVKWIDEGKIDYIVPQLYWEIGHKAAEYRTLAAWWNEHCGKTNLYVGLYASNLGNKTASKVWRQGNELCRQMKVNANYHNIKGIAMYSAIAIMQNRQGIRDSLRRGAFRYPSLVPSNKMLPAMPPLPPHNPEISFDYVGQKIFLRWKGTGERNIKYYVVYYFDTNENIATDNPSKILATTRQECLDITDVVLGNIDVRKRFVVSAVNRYNIESIATKAVVY